MKRPTYSFAARLVVLALALSGLASAQTAVKKSDNEGDTPDKPTTFGIRLRGFPVGSLSQLGDKKAHYTGSTEWIYNTTSRSPALGIGVMAEHKLSEHATLTAEIMFQRLRYSKVVDAWWGADDSSTTADERFHSFHSEVTKASLWDLPLLVHFDKFRLSRLPSRLWIAAGVTARAVSSIQTTNQYGYEDGASESNIYGAHPARRFLGGVTVGAGLRFLDDYRTRVMPEIRYTRWSGRAFSSDTTKTPTNQLDIGLGITF